MPALATQPVPIVVTGALMKRIVSWIASPDSTCPPGEEISTRIGHPDEQIIAAIRNHSETVYHPVGSCRMGNDAMAVVDDQLRVRGLQGLRVADASIMPTLIGGNTNAPSMVIGEKAAQMMLAAAGETQEAPLISATAA